MQIGKMTRKEKWKKENESHWSIGLFELSWSIGGGGCLYNLHIGSCGGDVHGNIVYLRFLYQQVAVSLLGCVCVNDGKGGKHLKEEHDTKDQNHSSGADANGHVNRAGLFLGWCSPLVRCDCGFFDRLVSQGRGRRLGNRCW